jgi:hypothetical protein
MKTFFRVLGLGAALGFIAPAPLLSQQEPLTAVDITSVSVLSGFGSIVAANLTAGGSGYIAAPVVTISGGGGSGATASAVIKDGVVTTIIITDGGVGYTSAPTITIAPPPAPGLPATAEIRGVGTTYQQPFQNESYGPVNVPITIAASARGTFPLGGYTYNFFVNGVPLGSSTNVQPPGGGPGYVSWAPPQPGSYLLTVTATAGSHTATSLAVRYFATGTAIVGPIDNSLVPNGSSVVLQATATPVPTAPNAFLQRIDFHVDGQLVGSDSTYPYSFIYTPAVSPTTHVVEARGFDNNGNQISPNGTATRRLHMVTPIGTPPSVRIVNPPTGSNVSSGSLVTFMTDAVAADGFIKNVDFYINGVLLSSAQRFPFTAQWTPQVPGRYQFVAIAFDDKSNAVASEAIFVTATGAFPTASIESPTSGITVVQGASVPVTVRAAGPDGGVASLKSIEFLVDGAVSDSLPKAATGGTGGTTTAPVLQDPFVFNWRSNVAVGTHRLSARVTDSNNLSITSSEIMVTVIPNQAPLVSLTSPSASTTITANSAVTVAASASDSDGSIDSVEFFANGLSLGRATSRPFQITWTPIMPGEMIVTAKAVDNGGAATTSAEVIVTVDPATSSSETGAGSIANTVYRGDYGSSDESGRFAFAINRNGRGTFIAFSTAPVGKSYFWNDIAVNADGTFAVTDSSNQVAVRGQTSVTGISGQFGGRTFIGPIAPATSTFTPLIVNGALTGVTGSQTTAIVGGDGSITLYIASGAAREVGTGFLTSAGTYSLASATGGRITGSASNGASIVSGSVTGAVNGSFLLRPLASRITNISTLALAGSGDRTLMAGFVVTGSGTKPLLIRAVGPSLVNFGVTAPIADPFLSVVSSSGTLLSSNNDWGNSTALANAAAQLGAFSLNAGSRDSALQVSLPVGTFTTVVGGGGVPGPALIEIYDADLSSTVNSRITNISTRGQVGVNNPMIAGFVITGDQRKRLMIRAVGPTLSSFGVTGALADPRIEVLFGNAVIASNNDWTETAVVAQVTATSPIVGAFPLNANSKDAAMVLQLNPGAYTVQIRGANGTTGTALVEIYDADL